MGLNYDSYKISFLKRPVAPIIDMSRIKSKIIDMGSLDFVESLFSKVDLEESISLRASSTSPTSTWLAKRNLA